VCVCVCVCATCKLAPELCSLLGFKMLMALEATMLMALETTRLKAVPALTSFSLRSQAAPWMPPG